MPMRNARGLGEARQVKPNVGAQVETPLGPGKVICTMTTGVNQAGVKPDNRALVLIPNGNNPRQLWFDWSQLRVTARSRR